MIKVGTYRFGKVTRFIYMQSYGLPVKTVSYLRRSDVSTFFAIWLQLSSGYTCRRTQPSMNTCKYQRVLVLAHECMYVRIHTAVSQQFWYVRPTIEVETNLIWVTFNVHIHMTLKRYVVEFL
jgi:hypothetical protein